MEHDEIYTKLCGARFNTLEQSQENNFKELKETQAKNHKEVMELLKGKGREEGLIGDVNKLKKLYNCSIGAFVFLISTLIIQIAIYIRSKL